MIGTKSSRASDASPPADGPSTSSSRRAGISPIADRQAHLTIRHRYSVPRWRQRHPRRGSALVVLVVVAPPHAHLVAPPGCAVEPLVHAPEAVKSARIGGIGVVDGAVLQREGAHARPLAGERGRIGSGHGGDPGDGPIAVGQLPLRAPVVVLDVSPAL